MMQEIGGASSVRGEACGVALQGLLIANPAVTVQEVWHDLGKYQAEFQQKLLGSKVSVEHSGTGGCARL